MKKILVIFSLIIGTTIGCNSLATTTVSLTKQEAVRAQAIAETRQQIAFARQQAQNEYTQKLNRLADQENILNLQAAQLCFDFKKAHKLPPNTNYTLDEWNGQLVKQ